MKQFNIGDKVTKVGYDPIETPMVYIGIHDAGDNYKYHICGRTDKPTSSEWLNDAEIKLFATAHYTAPAKFHKHDFAIETNAQDIEVIILDERDDHDLTYMCFDTLNGCKRVIDESALRVI